MRPCQPPSANEFIRLTSKQRPWHANKGLLAACASGPIRSLITIDTKPLWALWSQLRQILVLRLTESLKKNAGGRKQNSAGSKGKEASKNENNAASKTEECGTLWQQSRMTRLSQLNSYAVTFPPQQDGFQLFLVLRSARMVNHWNIDI